MKTGFLNIHDMVLIITIIECLFLMALLLVLPAQRKQPRQLLALFSFLIALSLCATIFIWNVDLQKLELDKTVIFPVLLTLSLLLQGPALYFYFRSLSEDIDLRHWRTLIHLVPALIAIATILIFGITAEDWLPWSQLASEKTAARKFVWALGRCLPFMYLVSSIWLEYQLRQQLKQNYSEINSLELRLADWVLLGFLISWSWSFVNYFLGGYFNAQFNDLMGIINVYLIVLQVNGLFAFGFKNTRELLTIGNELYKKNTPKADCHLYNEKIDIIEAAIHQQKLYLESNINLERFANDISMKPRDLSRIINTHYNVTFFDFINGFRIEEAKRLLASAEHAQDSILEIIFKSGFNSQASFQRHFNRIVGTTPTEYRKKVHAEK